MWSTKTSRSKRKRLKQKRAPLKRAPKRQCPVPAPGENKRAKTPKPVASIKLAKNQSQTQTQSHTWPQQSPSQAQGERTLHTADRDAAIGPIHNLERDIDPYTHTAASAAAPAVTPWPTSTMSCTPPPSMSLSMHSHSHSPPIWPSPSTSAPRSRPSSSRSLSAYQSLSPPPGSVGSIPSFVPDTASQSSATFTTPRMLNTPLSQPTQRVLDTLTNPDQFDENQLKLQTMELERQKLELQRQVMSYEQALSDVTSRFEHGFEQLTTRGDKLVSSSGPNSAEHSLSMRRNKELLCFGFIREHTLLTITAECDPCDPSDPDRDGDGDCERIAVPRDIMRFIFQHYDNTMVWDVRGADFEAFTRKETLKGPRFAIENVLTYDANTKSKSANTNANENVDDNAKEGETEDLKMAEIVEPPSEVEEDSLCLELELSHKEHADFVSCYLVSSRVPKGVKSMLISFTLFLRELQYECRSTMCYEDEDDAKGWNALAVPFGELRGLDSLHIECSVDILDIRFEPAAAECINSRAVERVMSVVPPIRDCLFLWHITPAQMEQFRGGTAKRYRYHYSDNFNHNCFVLGCDPHFNLEEFPDEEPKVLLALNMLRAPAEVRAVTLRVEFAAIADQRCFRHHQTTTLQLDAYETSCDELLFSSAMLQQLTSLSFMVELKVMEVKYKDGISHDRSQITAEING